MASVKKIILTLLLLTFAYEGYSQCGAAPTVTAGSRCGSGTVVLSANSASSGTFRWYSAASGGTLLQTSSSATSNNYTTPSISATTTYYVTFHNGTCESSPRTAVVATVHSLPTTPTAVAGASCGAGTVVLTANSTTAGTFKWYSASTGGTLLQTSSAGLTTNTFTTPSISASTTYFVTVTNSNNCESATRRSVTATINTVPVAPTITPGSTCGPGTVVLAANSTAAGTFKWYSASTGGTLLQTSAAAQTTNNFTTPSLSTTTTYFVSITNSSNCESTTRTAVTATVNANTPATSPSVTNGSRCGTGTVILGASSTTSGTFRWYSSLTGGTLLQTSGTSVTSNNFTTPSLTSNRTYFVTFHNGTCESSPRVAVTATVNSAVSAPTPIAASRCGTGTVVLSATSSTAGTFKWYSSLTGGTLLRTSPSSLTTDSYTTPSISANTTYYVTFSNSTCESTPRTAVVATVSSLPAAPSGVSGSRCGPGTVPLSASSATAGVFKWYTTSTGGVAIQTSASSQTSDSFTTPAISTTTPYYVSITNAGNCESTSRTLVNATIHPLPAMQELSGGGMYTASQSAEIKLSSSETGTNYQLQANQVNDGAVVAGTGNSLVWMRSSEGTYRVMATRGTCTSEMKGSAKVQNQINYSLDALSFLYKYDGRKRMTHKKVPGADWVYMVYDDRDRLVLTQDGNQRLQNQWIFTKYDFLNRPVLTGIYTAGSVMDQSAMQAQVNSYYNNITTNGGKWYETFSTTGLQHGYGNESFPLVADPSQYLTVTYYDTYDFRLLPVYANDTTYSYKKGQVAPQTSLTGTYSQDTTWHRQVKGQVTGSKVKVLDLSPASFLLTVSYYDDEYRLIQSISDNHKGGKDCITNVYDFTGKVLATQTTHSLPALQARTIARSFTYDHAGRLKKTWHTMNGSPAVLLAQNNYNELGQLITKSLHNTDSETTPDASRVFKQHVDYRYNIRGWLTGINDVQGASTADLFNMALSYNSPTINLQNPQYNGNISETIWVGPDGEKNAYTYKYDAMNRLEIASYQSITNPILNGRFDEKIINPATNASGSGYDLNGNIKYLIRNGKSGQTVGGSTTYGLMDDLKYSYLGNQLTKVEDLAIDTEGFKETNLLGDDYRYDRNGNMVKDKNKGLDGSDQAIEYNHLNLPKVVAKNTGDYIKYIYDAQGRKIKQEVYGSSNNIVKSTDYVGEYIYENNQLQLINHEEGRILKDSTTGLFNEYQYHLKDHLGNTRVTFTSKQEIEQDIATMETANDAAERSKFLNYDEAVVVNHPIFDRTNDNNPDAATFNATRLLGGNTNAIYGLAKSISVMPGDKIEMEVWAKYLALHSDPNQWHASLQSFLSAYVGGTTSAGTITDRGASGSLGTGSFPYSGILNRQDANQSAPKAYLNWLVFDKDFNPIPGEGGFVQISIDAADDGTLANKPHFLMKRAEPLLVKQPGYVYIYLSNENESIVEVFFDDFKVTHTKSEVIQVDDYYPFGLTFNSYSRENSTTNDYKFTGKEEQNELGLNLVDFGLRMYDPAIARWMVIDPLAHKLYAWSPFNYALNNPVMFVDPDGALPWPVHVRSFISTPSTAGGRFLGDGRGPSTANSPQATSRVRSSFTVDPSKGTVSNLQTKSDLTVFVGVPSPQGGIPPKVDEGKPEASISNVQSSENTTSLDFSHSGKDPITPGFLTPALDVHSSLSITEDMDKGVLSINGSFTGDSFPSTEAFIVDQSGNGKVFLGAQMEQGGIKDLFGDNKEPLFKVNIQVQFDSKGNFTGVQQGDKKYTVEEWNKQVQDSFNKN